MQFNTIILYAILFGFYLHLDSFIGKTYEIKNKCAVVTGASSGIGVYIADALAAKGISHLIVAARRYERLQVVAENFTSIYPNLKVRPVKIDVLSKEDRKNLQIVVSDFFPKRCTVILVNNAGVEHWHPFETLNEEKMEQQINVNLLALMKITQDFLPRILRQKKGHIVNVASQAGAFSVPYGASYAASKHGVVGFTKAIRNEFRTKGDISVGVILPGYITRTGMYDDMIKSSDTIENLDEYIYYNQLLVGTSEPEDSANAVIHAITTDSPHIHVNGLNGNIMFNINRFYVILAELFPRFYDFAYTTIMAKPVEFMETLAKFRERQSARI